MLMIRVCRDERFVAHPYMISFSAFKQEGYSVNVPKKIERGDIRSFYFFISIRQFFFSIKETSELPENLLLD